MNCHQDFPTILRNSSPTGNVKTSGKDSPSNKANHFGDSNGAEDCLSLNLEKDSYVYIYVYIYIPKNQPSTAPVSKTSSFILVVSKKRFQQVDPSCLAIFGRKFSPLPSPPVNFQQKLFNEVKTPNISKGDMLQDLRRKVEGLKPFKAVGSCWCFLFGGDQENIQTPVKGLAKGYNANGKMV